VTRCDPPIANLGILVQQLNEDRNIMGFIKRGQSFVQRTSYVWLTISARKAFRQLVPEPPKQPSRFDDLSGPGYRIASDTKKAGEDVLYEAGVSGVRPK
jgi:kinetochore protein Spc25